MINLDMIEKIETVFRFSLYEWQKDYLLGKPHDYPCGGRANGKTFVYCLKVLLSDEKSIPRNINEFKRLADNNAYSPRYRQWFAEHLYWINEKLELAGIETRIEK